MALLSLLSLLCRVLTPRRLELLSPTSFVWDDSANEKRLGGKLFLQSLNDRVSELESWFDRSTKGIRRRLGFRQFSGRILRWDSGFGCCELVAGVILVLPQESCCTTGTKVATAASTGR
ncbi:hypothetical protein ACFX13_013126 [Malus domestica]